MSLENEIWENAHEINLKGCERNGLYSRRHNSDYGRCIYFARPMCMYKVISKHTDGSETHLCTRWLERGVRAIFRRPRDQYGHKK